MISKSIAAMFMSCFSDHIDYVKDLIGVDYVGIGADYDGVPV